MVPFNPYKIQELDKKLKNGSIKLFKINKKEKRWEPAKINTDKLLQKFQEKNFDFGLGQEPFAFNGKMSVIDGANPIKNILNIATSL